ncbi:MAG: sigma factor-like helix-turn-helix DNA-binding protein, partial [Jiangellaceae bacterium]
ALDRLRSRTRHANYAGTWLPDPVPTDPSPLEPLTTAEQRESASTATLFLMERLNPLERAVFVLRSAFNLPYAEIAEIVERSDDYCRQLFRRSDRRLRNDRARFAPSRREHAALLERFLEAARNGDLAGLTAQLREDVVIWSDGGGKARAAARPIEGAAAAARFFAGIYGRGPVQVRPIELNGSPAVVVTTSRSHHTLGFTVADGLVSGFYLTTNPDKLRALDPRAGGTGHASKR